MIKKIKEKLNNTWSWTKRKIKKILIGLGIIGVVLAIGGYALYQILAIDVIKIPGFSR